MNWATPTAGTLGPEPTVAVRVGTEILEIALRGATPLRWLVDLPSGTTDVLDGYRDAGELYAQDGVRNGVMAPFCNRVADAKYVFDGIEHDLLPGEVDRTIYHGLVRSLPFTLDEVCEEDDGARVTFRCDALSAGLRPGYPFAIEVEVSYHLRVGSLQLEITGRNAGKGAAPFAAGWHPYFRLPGASTVDQLHLTLSSSVEIRTDADLIPHPGAAAYRALAAAPVRFEPIGDATLDRCYADLRSDRTPRRAVLHDPATGVELAVWADRGLVHVFSGDTLARDRRASVAIEPVEVMTDAFNRPECAAAIRLEPGERRTFRCGVEISST